MKKYLFIPSGLLLIMVLIVSCSKEEIPERIDIQESTEQDLPQFNEQPPFVDLTISRYFTDIGVESYLCTDTLLPTTHCDYGVRNFKASVSIVNIGNIPLAPGIVEVLWYDWTWALAAIQPYQHNGIAVGDSIIVSRPYYVGPCDCVDIPGDANCFIHRYQAYVDPNLVIPELNENNNISEVYDTCDGCGPCEVEPVPVPTAEPQL